MKKFYSTVSVGIPKYGSYSILLDGKPVKTPRRADLIVPWHGLADAIAEEWRKQGDEIDPNGMFLTKCANSAVDYTTGHEGAVVDGILAYANDLLCYRATEPADLVARQSATWDPLLDWLKTRYGVELFVGTGVTHVAHEEAALAKLREAIAAENAFVLTALHGAATLCGSLVLSLAILEGRLTAEEAFAASRLDEEYQAEKWGRDAGVEMRSRFMLAELEAAALVMCLARTPV